MKKPRLWTGAVWVWWAVWAVCCLLLATFWAQALTSRGLSILNARQVAMTSCMRDLSQAFGSLQRLASVLVASLAHDAEKRQPDMNAMRKQAEPFCHLFWIGADGAPMVAGDPSPPVWMPALLAPRLKVAGPGVVVIRPEPPGMEAGRLPLEEPAGTPSSYLLTCVRGPHDSVFVAEMDLDYVYGPWLTQRVGRFDFGLDASAHRIAVDDPAPPRWPAPHLPESPGLLAGWQSLREASGWSWRMASFFPDDPNPFDAIEIDLSNTRVLAENLNVHLIALAGGSVVMLIFALSIRLAARGLRRELEFVEARARFTALVSHELRTPIAAIRMYSEILENGLVADPEKIASYHHIIGVEAGRLGNLVDNLLAMGSLERRAFKLASVDLNAVARETIGTEPVTLELDETLPRVRADRDATVQVLSNLVQNAFKYGGSPPQVTIASRRSGQRAAIDVMDRGAGIPPAARRKIFEPYHRLHNAATEGKRGVGLGLALVKGFIEGQGGIVQVADRPGGGAIFTIMLPLDEEGR